MAEEGEPLQPLGVISPANQSGLVLIITALSLCFVVVAFAIRIYIRVPSRLWKTDDNIITVATILSCIQTTLVFLEVHKGFGNDAIMSKVSNAAETVRKYYFANDFLYIVVLATSKAAVGTLFLRLTRAKAHIFAIWCILGLCGAWFLTSILLLAIGNSWRNVWEVPFARWLAIGITDCVTEVIFVVMSGYLVKDLRMSIVQKSTVVFAFALRLLTIPACAIRLHYLSPSTLADNRAFAISLAVVCTQVQLGYGIMAASVTVLKPFMVVYEKPDGYTSNSAANKYYGSNNSFAMKNMSKNGGATAGAGADGQQAPGAPNGAEKNHHGGDSRNVSSSHEKVDSIHSHDDSRRLIIEQKIDWSVTYEEEDKEHSPSRGSVTGTSV